MGMPQLVVTAVLVEGRSKSEVAREYGVSRRWVITLVQRYLAEGQAGLQPRSRRPLTSPQRTTQELERMQAIECHQTLVRTGEFGPLPSSRGIAFELGPPPTVYKDEAGVKWPPAQIGRKLVIIEKGAAIISVLKPGRPLGELAQGRGRDRYGLLVTSCGTSVCTVFRSQSELDI